MQILPGGTYCKIRVGRIKKRSAVDPATERFVPVAGTAFLLFRATLPGMRCMTLARPKCRRPLPSRAAPLRLTSRHAPSVLERANKFAVSALCSPDGESPARQDLLNIRGRASVGSHCRGGIRGEAATVGRPAYCCNGNAGEAFTDWQNQLSA